MLNGRRVIISLPGGLDAHSWRENTSTALRAKTSRDGSAHALQSQF
jgi:hypothetical protein